MTDLNRKKVQALLNEAAFHHSLFHLFMCSIRDRLKGAEEIEARLLSHPKYENYLQTLQERKYYHPLFDTLLDQERRITPTARSFFDRPIAKRNWRA